MKNVWHVPQCNQGQIVEVAYRAHDGYVYRRTTDKSTLLVTYHRSPILMWDDEDYWNAPPKNKRWAKCSENVEE